MATKKVEQTKFSAPFLFLFYPGSGMEETG